MKDQGMLLKRRLQKYTNRNFSISGNQANTWESVSFHQAAEVLQRPIRSIYPGGTNPRLRRDLNQMILPNLDIASDKTPVYIMWTPLHSPFPENCGHFKIVMLFFMLILQVAIFEFLI